MALKDQYPEIQAVLDGKSEGCIVQGDCLEILPLMPDDCVDAVVTDPPYGCGKADWDDAFPTTWYEAAKRVTRMVGVITGGAGLRDAVLTVGKDFIDTIAARNMNGCTRSAIGFSNWIACVVACGKPRMGPNAFDFSIRGKMPDHPSPKPIEYMDKLIARLSEPNTIILDPFCGSGTTCIAAKKLGRRWIGIELDEKYCRIARNRLRDTPRPLFTETD